MFKISTCMAYGILYHVETGNRIEAIKYVNDGDMSMGLPWSNRLVDYIVKMHQFSHALWDVNGWIYVHLDRNHNPDLSKVVPYHKHDCDDCRFVGHAGADTSDGDMYYCPSHRDYIVRYSSDEWDYNSIPEGLAGITQNPDIVYCINTTSALKLNY